MGNSGGRTVVGVLRGDGAVGFTVQSSTNRYTSIGGNSISHDDAGNLTVDKDGYKYFYDYENRVVRIQKPDGLGGWDDVAQMAYDTLGRRIRVIDSVASTTTLYYYNPEWQCLAEYSGAGTLQRYFVYGNYIDEPLVMHRQSDGEDYYYGQDHLYSTAVLLDDSGNVAERYEYDAYGTVLVYTEDGDDNDWFDGDETTATASAKGNPYTFTGRRLDVLDGGSLVRMHYRHRDYDVYAGRFLQHDPVGLRMGFIYTFSPPYQYANGSNLYQYVRSKPADLLDPSGLNPTFGPPYIAPPGLIPPEPPALIPPDVTPYPLPGPAPLPEPGGTDPGVPDCTAWQNNGGYYEDEAMYREWGATQVGLIDMLSGLISIAGGGLDTTLGLVSELGIDLNMISWSVQLDTAYAGAYPGMPCKCVSVYKRRCKRECCHWWQRENKKVLAWVTLYGEAVRLSYHPTKMKCWCQWPQSLIFEFEETMKKATDCDQLNKK